MLPRPTPISRHVLVWACGASLVAIGIMFGDDGAVIGIPGFLVMVASRLHWRWRHRGEYIPGPIARIVMFLVTRGKSRASGRSA